MPNRRQFLLSAATAAASRSWAAAGNRVRVGIIGVGSRGTAHIRECLAGGVASNIEIAALVDPDGTRTEKAAAEVLKRTGKAPRLESDMRRVFDDPNIDAVTIATTNHWHALTAIWAMQAGKDVYVEKPVSHNVFEGVQLVAAARKYKRIAAGGTQRRWWGRFRKAVERLHAGAIGEIYQGNFFFPGRRDSIGFQPHQPPPSWLNWDLWLGPAPTQQYHANLVHYNWHWFWDFGNGELGNNGIHMIDFVRWGMRRGLPEKVHCSGGRFGYRDQAETPNTQNVTWTYGDGATMLGQLRGLYTDEKMSWDFFGSKGHMHVMEDGRFRLTLGRSNQPEPEEADIPANLDHFANFADAVRARDRKLLHAEIEETAISSAMCHLGNIAYRVGHELSFDPASMRFADSEPWANALLRRDYRTPYVVPEKV